MSLSAFDANTADSVSALGAGRFELAIGYFPELLPMASGLHLVTLNSVGIADRSNPWLRNGAMDLESFLAAPHVLNTIANDPNGSDVDRFLNARAGQRRIMLQLPHTLALPAAIRGTDLVAVVERGMLARLPDQEGLIAFELPIPQPNTGISLIWHERHESDPAHRWMRTLISEVAKSLVTRV